MKIESGSSFELHRWDFLHLPIPTPAPPSLSSIRSGETVDESRQVSGGCGVGNDKTIKVIITKFITEHHLIPLEFLQTSYVKDVKTFDNILKVLAA